MIDSGSTLSLAKPDSAPSARGSHRGSVVAVALSLLAHAAVAASIVIGETPQTLTVGAVIDIETVNATAGGAAKSAPRKDESQARAASLTRPMSIPDGAAAADPGLATPPAARPEIAAPTTRPRDWHGRPPEAPASAETLALSPPRGVTASHARPIRANNAAPTKRLARPEMEERGAGSTTSAAATDAEASTHPPRLGHGAAVNPAPEYPEEARLHGWHGRVVLAVTVSPDGGVTNLRVQSSSGHALLDEAALRAVRRWRFEPGRRGGIAVTAAVEVPVRFRLTD